MTLLSYCGSADYGSRIGRSHLDHLLAQQRAASALDQVELRVDLVGACSVGVGVGVRVGVRARAKAGAGARAGARARVRYCHTVDGHVQHGVLPQRGQRDAQALGLLLGADRGRDGDDVLELARLELLAHALHGEVGRAATRTQARVSRVGGEGGGEGGGGQGGGGSGSSGGWSVAGSEVSGAERVEWRMHRGAQLACGSRHLPVPSPMTIPLCT